MTRTRVEDGLPERLVRLGGRESDCCVPEYQRIAKEVRSSAAFPSALRRVKALSDENRLLAASLLKRRGELCACEIQAATGLTHPTVSHHMGVLVAAGLVRSRRKGKWLYYRLSNDSRMPLP
ncbi:MAG: metalloregulator ArsR/SmtB family transcription factor [Thermoplasmata archaeon]|nr:metalloregulator ArsR/SmtB family transcription factor [Thermoplasmata archaeon]MCI4340875.1 metalloregulator ArsR/SmtB family transcription factor [Thermoplasmata archaeon]